MGWAGPGSDDVVGVGSMMGSASRIGRHRYDDTDFKSVSPLIYF